MVFVIYPHNAKDEVVHELVFVPNDLPSGVETVKVLPFLYSDKPTESVDSLVIFIVN